MLTGSLRCGRESSLPFSFPLTLYIMTRILDVECYFFLSFFHSTDTFLFLFTLILFRCCDYSSSSRSLFSFPASIFYTNRRFSVFQRHILHHQKRFSFSLFLFFVPIPHTKRILGPSGFTIREDDLPRQSEKITLEVVAPVSSPTKRSERRTPAG